MTDLATYLAGLKAGDVVTIKCGSYPGDLITQTVEQRTPKRIQTTKGNFCPVSGYGMGRQRKGRIITPDQCEIVQALAKVRLATSWLVTAPNADDMRRALPAMRAALDRAEAALREGEQ